MSTYNVKVRTETGERHHFDQIASSSADAIDAAAARFGYLCAVLVTAK
ncbi:MAG: hypothetical protein WKG03_00090 [Telluria sp.]